MTDNDEYVVEATYTTTKELIVKVKDGTHPDDVGDPSTWAEIVDERDQDCQLFNVTGWRVND